ncbi:MAG: conjugal transfer protein TraF [Candidatus Obscuribacterales bacterium]|nr:conjugal transfer protein TraF [Candidatus Obscuribacterales bacterium]
MHRIAALVAPAALLWQCFAAGSPALAIDLPAVVSAHPNPPVGRKFREFSDYLDDAPKRDDRPKILEFYATWCEPCKQMKPTLDTLKRRYGNEIEWVSCDVDDPANAKLAKQYEICPIPALVFLNSREEVVCYAIGSCQKQQEEILVRQIERIVPKKAIGVGIGVKGSPTVATRKQVQRHNPITVRKAGISRLRPARREPSSR